MVSFWMVLTLAYFVSSRDTLCLRLCAVISIKQLTSVLWTFWLKDLNFKTHPESCGMSAVFNMYLSHSFSWHCQFELCGQKLCLTGDSLYLVWAHLSQGCLSSLFCCQNKANHSSPVNILIKGVSGFQNSPRVHGDGLSLQHVTWSFVFLALFSLRLPGIY